MSGPSMDEIFDEDVVNSLKEVLGAGIARIISVYLDETPNDLQAMRDALQNQDFKTIGRLAHSLKSSSGNLGALHMVQQSKDLEALINEDVNDEHAISEFIDRLELSLAQIKPMLLKYMTSC